MRLPSHGTRLRTSSSSSPTTSVPGISRAADARAGRPLFLYYSPYVPHVPLAVPDEFKGSTRAGDYGDYVHALDHHVGRVLAALERHGLADNTLVVIASDNGPEFVTTGNGHHPNGGFRGPNGTSMKAACACR